MVLPEAVALVLNVPVLGQQAHALLGLVIRDPLLLVQGGGKGRLGLHHEVGVVVELLQLPEQVLVIDLLISR